MDSNEAQSCNDLQTPRNELDEYLAHPPIFSGRPFLNLTLSESNQPASAVYSVPSLLTPGANCILVKGI